MPPCQGEPMLDLRITKGSHTITYQTSGSQGVHILLHTRPPDHKGFASRSLFWVYGHITHTTHVAFRRKLSSVSLPHRDLFSLVFCMHVYDLCFCILWLKFFWILPLSALLFYKILPLCWLCFCYVFWICLSGFSLCSLNASIYPHYGFQFIREYFSICESSGQRSTTSPGGLSRWANCCLSGTSHGLPEATHSAIKH